MGTAPTDTPGQRGLTGGEGVARPAGKSRGSGGGCTGLKERQRLSPRCPGVVEAVKVLSGSGVLPDGGAPVIYDILRWVLQQGAEEGEVRDYLAEGKGSTRVELTAGKEMVARRREDGAGQRRSGRPARTRGRGENGRGALAWPAEDKNGRGRKRGRGGNMRPFKRAQRGGGGGRSAEGTTQ
jgi:hypothetical protein